MNNMNPAATDQKIARTTAMNNFKSNVPVNLRVNDVVTMNNLQKKVAETVHGKLNYIEDKLRDMNEKLLKEREELVEMENILKSLNEKFVP